jgi:uncharacterized RDD family membrane protein YckC
MSLDYIYLLSIFIPFWLILLLPYLLTENNQDSLPNFLNQELIPAFVVIGIFLIVVLNKDFFQGRSVAKRMLGYQLVDTSTNAIASDLQCCVRNLTLLIWPIEVIVALFYHKRRIGDLLAGTQLSEVEPVDPQTILVDAKEKSWNARSRWTIFLSAGIAILFPLWLILIEFLMFR